jgi:hypothetical protein
MMYGTLFLCSCTQSNIKISQGCISPIIIIVVINYHAYGAWVGVLGKPTGSSDEYNWYWVAAKIGINDSDPI